MKILFVENRYKTALWELVGKMYQKAGHEIHWIIQNPQFLPSFGHKNILPFPKGKVAESSKENSSELEKIIKSNRGINYFQVKSDNFIYHYAPLIDDLIQQISPDVVFGEATAFHELLVSKSCYENGILFLNPSSSRYPSRRFSFYEYDSLTPFSGSGESFTETQAMEFIERISTRVVKPDYMRKNSPKNTRLELISDKLRLVRGFYQGERYNTPSPFVKRDLQKKNTKLVQEWDALAVKQSDIPDGFKALYALQMQPEANIDVWGYPHRNQTTVIREIAANLKDDEILIVKPNPKSKYEIDEELMALIQLSRGKIYPLHHSSKMEDVWDEVDLVVTVTGTVSIECVFSNKPVAMLGIGIQTQEKNCIVLKSLSELRNVIESIKTETFPQLTLGEKINFLNKLVNTSYNGVIADGFFSKDELENPENERAILKAFHNIITQVESKI